MGTFPSFSSEGYYNLFKMPARKPEQEKEVLDWIAAVLGEPLPQGQIEDVLKNGVILCKLMNKISPGAIPKFKEKGMPFVLMENIQSFLKAVKAYGVPDNEVFQTVDLFEAKNIPQVVLCIYCLARTTQRHPEYKGPSMGPKMATANKRNFTEEDPQRTRWTNR